MFSLTFDCTHVSNKAIFFLKCIIIFRNLFYFNLDLARSTTTPCGVYFRLVCCIGPFIFIYAARAPCPISKCLQFHRSAHHPGQGRIQNWLRKIVNQSSNLKWSLENPYKPSMRSKSVFNFTKSVLPQYMAIANPVPTATFCWYKMFINIPGAWLN